MSANVEHYSYRVFWSEEDGEYVGAVAEFPLLSWLDEDRTEALKGIVEMTNEVVADRLASGEDVPQPISDRQYSGRFNVRVPTELHRDLVREAAEQGISLNRLVSDRLARSV